MCNSLLTSQQAEGFSFVSDYEYVSFSFMLNSKYAESKDIFVCYFYNLIQ